MKSFIRIFVLFFIYFEASSLGINIFHYEQTETALSIYKSLISKGISHQLISIINKEQPCKMTYENSFVDICIDEAKKMRVIRKTNWLYNSLKPLKNEQSGL